MQNKGMSEGFSAPRVRDPPAIPLLAEPSDVQSLLRSGTRCLCPLSPLTCSWRNDHGREARGQESIAGVQVHERENLSTVACEASLSLPVAICLPSESHPKHTCGPQTLQPEWGRPLFLGDSLPLESLLTSLRKVTDTDPAGHGDIAPPKALPEPPQTAAQI